MQTSCLIFFAGLIFFLDFFPDFFLNFLPDFLLDLFPHFFLDFFPYILRKAADPKLVTTSHFLNIAH